MELSVFIVRKLDVMGRHQFIKSANDGKRGGYWSEGQGSKKSGLP
jgi:hypothetical protein